MLNKPRYLVGIDPGVNTGWAVWDRTERKLIECETLKIHEVILMLDVRRKIVSVRFEDARKRTWFGQTGREKLQGVGSVKRDSGIIEDTCIAFGIDFFALKPAAGMTKWSDKYFRNMTGWQGRTSEHARDAACLIFGG